MRKGTALVIALLLGTALAAAPAAAAEVKVGFVNMQRALEQSAAGQQATKKLQELADKTRGQLQAAKEKLDALKAEIDKQSLLWNEKTRRDKEDEARRMERDYQRLLKDSTDEIKTRESEFSESIGKELLRVTEDIGKAEGFTLIMERRAGGIIYAPASIDLTDRVIKAYDAQKQ